MCYPSVAQRVVLIAFPWETSWEDLRDLMINALIQDEDDQKTRQARVFNPKLGGFGDGGWTKGKPTSPSLYR